MSGCDFPEACQGCGHGDSGTALLGAYTLWRMDRGESIGLEFALRALLPPTE